MKKKTLRTGPLRRSNRISGLPPEVMIPTEFTPSKSRLLNLPPEIRNIIWNMVLGDQAIYICNVFGSPAISICQSQLNSKVCHEMFVHENPDSEYFGASSPDAAKYAEETNYACVTSHMDCPLISSARGLSLNFLRCRRQVYFESNLIPYLSNEFIFGDANAFRWFIRKISPAQMKAVTSITLQLKCHDRIHRFSERNFSNPHIGYWNIVLEPALIQQLVGLKNLQINLWGASFEFESFKNAIKLGPLAIGSALGFGRLPLKTVKTIVMSNPLAWLESGLSRGFQWSLTARQTLAKEINATLLQPELYDISEWEELLSLCKGMTEYEFWPYRS